MTRRPKPVRFVTTLPGQAPFIDEQQRGNHRSVILWSGKINNCRSEDDRYVSVHIHVYEYEGKLPSLVVQPSANLYALGTVRRVAELLLCAAEWIAANVPEYKVRG